jgi:hypothetical protein
MKLPSDLVYGSIRQEILDQKKCQFQLFSLAVTVNSAILAYGAASDVGPLLYVAPMVLNLLALIIIVDKAVSIQRKVGYLQMMERDFTGADWKWETHLDRFRVLRGVYWKSSGGGNRRHSYITSITLMFVILNFLCAGLWWWGPVSSTRPRQVGWLDAFVLVLLCATLYAGFAKRESLVRGENSSDAITAKWDKVLKDEIHANKEKPIRLAADQCLEPDGDCGVAQPRRSVIKE